MIGSSLSGVTFISVPGAVGTTAFGYFQVVLGYILGYVVIAEILIPLYYRMNLTSIYSYLESRLGFWSYKTGSFYFILSRIIGAAFRLFIVVNVLQLFVFDAWGIPFWLTSALFIIVILLYTYKGGVKTIVYTDALQTTFLLGTMLLAIVLLSQDLNIGLGSLPGVIADSDYSKIFFWDWQTKLFFPKHFFGGMFIAIAMTGLDQDMMQKNISVRTMQGAKKNIYVFTAVLTVVNLLFLALGALLYLYATAKGIPIPKLTDELFPTLALHYLGGIAGILFIIGIISATYSSADGSLTALTTSFCIDVLGMNKKNWDEQKRTRIRHTVHLTFATVLLLVMVLFKIINNAAVIQTLFTVASFTYGPLLGLYGFGLFSRRAVNDALVPLVCVAAPAICFVLNLNSATWFNGYLFGFELIILNGSLTFLGLWAVSKKKSTELSNAMA
jgi:Na+/proline symporter